MDIEIPTVMHTAGGSQTKQVYCITKGASQDQFYTYSYPEGVDIYRAEWRLVNGYKLVEANNSTAIRNFTLWDWQCLSQEDMVYKPELKVYFPLLSIAIFCLILAIIYKTIIKRLLP